VCVVAVGIPEATGSSKNSSDSKAGPEMALPWLLVSTVNLQVSFIHNYA
jgi:hypothetical protein